MKCRALKGGIDVLANERSLLRQRLKRTIEKDMSVGKFSPGLGRKGQQGSGTAFNIDPAILARCAGRIVELVELFLTGKDREPERLEHSRTLVKRLFP